MSDLKVPYNIESDYSEGFVDFFSKQPKWIVRYGLLIIFTILLFIIFLGWMIRYPDTVSSRIVVTSENPPVFVYSKINGVIESVFVDDQSEVFKDQTIALLVNNAKYSDYLYLKEVLNYNLYDSLLTRQLIVGEIQGFLNNFIFEIQKEKIKNLLNENQIRETDLYLSLGEARNLTSNQLNKLQLLNEELELEENRIQRYRELYNKGVISRQDLEDNEKKFLMKKQVIQDNHSMISSSRIDIINIQKFINENRIQDSERDLIQRENIENARLLLLEKIAEWEDKYLLRSPIEGILYFHNFLVTQNKNITIEQDVFSIVPNNHGLLFGTAEIPIIRSGKVKKGQLVNIYLDNYPFEEFGVIKGKIKEISSIPSDNGYLSKVELVDNLKTSYNIGIDFKPNLSGRAEIITEDLNLFTRIFNQFIKLFENA